jgi:hypothetical protein
MKGFMRFAQCWFVGLSLVACWRMPLTRWDLLVPLLAWLTPPVLVNGVDRFYLRDLPATRRVRRDQRAWAQHDIKTIVNQQDRRSA